MHVIAHRLQVSGARSIHHQRLVASAEQVPEEFVPTVEAGRVRAQEPLHARNQVGLRRLHHQMKMIRHEHVGVDLPPGLGASISQRLDEPLPILVILENSFPPIPAVHDVINRLRILHSQFASHGRTLPSGTSDVNNKN